MNVETEIEVIKSQIRYLTKAYTAGLFVNGLSLLGIIITLATILVKS